MNVTSIFIAYVTIKLNLIQWIAGYISLSVLKVGIFVFIITNRYLITVIETQVGNNDFQAITRKKLIMNCNPCANRNLKMLLLVQISFFVSMASSFKRQISKSSQLFDCIFLLQSWSYCWMRKAVETRAVGECSHSISRSPKLSLVFV